MITKMNFQKESERRGKIRHLYEKAQNTSHSSPWYSPATSVTWNIITYFGDNQLIDGSPWWKYWPFSFIKTFNWLNANCGETIWLIDNCDIYQLIDLWQTVMTILISPFLSRLPFCCWSRLACRRYWTFDQNFHSALTFHINPQPVCPVSYFLLSQNIKISNLFISDTLYIWRPVQFSLCQLCLALRRVRTASGGGLPGKNPS